MEIIQKQNQVQIKGAVTFDNARQLLSKFRQLKLDKSDLLIDCSQISHANSVVLSCLLEVIKIGQKQGKQVKVMNLPENLARVAKISHLDQIF